MIDDGGDSCEKKQVESNEQLELHKSFLQKILTRAFFLLASAAKMLGTRRVPVGCMNWQHAVILESIFETNLVLILLPA